MDVESILVLIEGNSSFRLVNKPYTCIVSSFHMTANFFLSASCPMRIRIVAFTKLTI